MCLGNLVVPEGKNTRNHAKPTVIGRAKEAQEPAVRLKLEQSEKGSKQNSIEL
jgi:hypothetical protein